MPQQTGVIKISGTLGNITFYYAWGKHLCRRKSSINKERIKNDPAYEKIRRHQPLFSAAAKLASIVHRQLSHQQKRRNRMGKLTKEIWPLIRQKHSEKKILLFMQQRYGIVIKNVKSKRVVYGILRASGYRTQTAPVNNSIRPSAAPCTVHTAILSPMTSLSANWSVRWLPLHQHKIPYKYDCFAWRDFIHL